MKKKIKVIERFQEQHHSNSLKISIIFECLICMQPLKSLLKSNSNDWLHVCFLFKRRRKQNISPRPGIEPGSPAIHMERGRLLTGGYTDHYTNEDLTYSEIQSNQI